MHEVQFGYLRRPVHATRPYDAARFEVCNQKWSALTEEGRGFAILNDSKYGVNVESNSINLTLLKASLAPDMYADKGAQEFTYSFYFWNGAFIDSGVTRAGYELNVPVTQAGGNAGEKSIIEIGGKNIIIESVKSAEDNSGDIIMRLYESVRNAASSVFRVNIPFKRIVISDMLENEKYEIKSESGEFALHFNAFEIKTIRLVMSSESKRSTKRF